LEELSTSEWLRPHKTDKGVIDMRAHSQTIDRRPQVNVTLKVGVLDWCYRLYQWFRSASHGQREIGPVSSYGTWDAQRERFQTIPAVAAIDIVAARSGMSWLTSVYTAEI
jgi:hypothetical protein